MIYPGHRACAACIVTTIITGLTANMIGITLKTSVVDLNLYKNHNYKSSINDPFYDEQISKNLINVDGEARSLLMQNVFSLLWTKDNKDILGNGFLIDIVKPNDKISSSEWYSPDWSEKSEDIQLIVGTSFQFVQKIFTGIDNFSEEINNSSVGKKINEIADNKTGNFYISNVGITYSDSESNMEPIYKKNQTSNKTSSKQQIKTEYKDLNHYLEIENTKVELVYAAADLELNNELFKLPDHKLSIKNIEKHIKYLKKMNRNDIVWKKTINSNSQDAFAVDFAVLKISLSMTDMHFSFLRHLKKSFSKESLTELNRGNFAVINKKVGEIFTGGWIPLNPKEQEYLNSKNLYPKLIIKQDKKDDLKLKLPSEINDYTEYFELKFFENIFDTERTTDKVKNAAQKAVLAELSQKYEWTNITKIPDDEYGSLLINFQIKHKAENITFPEQYSQLFINFKANNSNDFLSIAENIPIFEDKQKLLEEKFKFSEEKLFPNVRWSENYFSDPYFDLNDIKNDYWFNQTRLAESNEPFSSIAINNKKYVNVGHHLTVLQPTIENQIDALVLTGKWNHQKRNFLGFFKGITTHKNWLSGDKKVGKIMLFSSPIRYNLITRNNNYTKLSLYDSLNKKSIVLARG